MVFSKIMEALRFLGPAAVSHYSSRFSTVLSFPLHSLSPLSNHSSGNLVVLASSQFKHAGYGYTHFC